MFNSFNKSLNVEFFSVIPYLNEIEECRPKESREFIPSWWKDMPKQLPFPNTQTVKVCPSFLDYFSQGYTIPMWADTTLYSDSTTGEWRWTSGNPSENNPFVVSFHDREQFIKFVSPKLQGSEGTFVFKFHCPWQVITPKGYSMLQIPLFYHFDDEFSVLPGVIHTDMHHDINQQVVYYGDKKEVFIKRGTPIVQLIPFKREKFELLTRDANTQDLRKRGKYLLDLQTKYIGSGTYRKNFKRSGRQEGF